MASREKFWSDLSVKTRNALLAEHVREPWNEPVGKLLRIPRIGPGAIEEIAKAVQRNWSALKPDDIILRIANDR